MERVINLNTYQAKQALYRGFKIIQGKCVLTLFIPFSGLFLGADGQHGRLAFDCPP